MQRPKGWLWLLGAAKRKKGKRPLAVVGGIASPVVEVGVVAMPKLDAGRPLRLSGHLGV